MARTGGTKRYFNFVKGKHSDGSALVPPEGTARVLMNVDLSSSGKIARRLGLDFEEDFEVAAGPFPVGDLKSSAISMHEWLTVDNSPTANFVVVRVAHVIYFFNAGANPISGGLLGSVDISGLTVDEPTARKSEIQVASGKGLLFVAGDGYRPLFVKFDPDTDTFTATPIRVEIRDTIGLDDEIGVNERPEEMSQSHAWNLLNQGWDVERINEFFAETTTYPSNADIQHLGYKIDMSSGDKVWDHNEILNTDFGTTKAARGKFVLDAFTEDRITALNPGLEPVVFNYSTYLGETFLLEAKNFVQVSHASVSPLVPAGGSAFRPKAIAFFAGRVWYASVQGKIYFSQIVQDDTYVGRCFQEQDPTAEDFNELVDTDGGVLLLPEAGDVVSLISSIGGLLVFATGGIWIITGGEGHFSANNTFVRKVSNTNISNGKAVVEAEGTVFFWSEEGIFVLSTNDITGLPTAKSLSIARIQRDYNLIPLAAKRFAQGAYDRVAKKIYWFYSDGLADANESIQAVYNAAIIYDLVLDAFTDYRIEDSGPSVFQPFVAGALKRSGVNQVDVTSTIQADADDVVAGTDLVQISAENINSTDFPITMLAFYPVTVSGTDFQFTFAEFCSRSFHDWEASVDYEVNYDSIIETNPETLGDGMMDKSATWLYSYYDYKRDGFGELEFQPRFDIREGFRVSQNVIEVLRQGIPELRATQNVIEVLRQGQPDLRATQNLIEVLRAV